MSLKKWIFALIFCQLSWPILALDESTVQQSARKGTVALTFDDGPTVKYTPEILAILKKYKIKATFFMVGENAKAHPEIVRMVLADGQAIANHSMTHPRLTKLNDADLYREVTEPQTVIYKITGKKTVCLRYPFGASSDHVNRVIRENGMVPTPVGLNSYDYKRPGVDKIVSWVMKNTHSGQVFVFHDGFDNREQTVAALPKIIERIKEKGLGFSQICVN